MLYCNSLEEDYVVAGEFSTEYVADRDSRQEARRRVEASENIISEECAVVVDFPRILSNRRSVGLGSEHLKWCIIRK